jgi:hypothetical protein
MRRDTMGLNLSRYVDSSFANPRNGRKTAASSVDVTLVNDLENNEGDSFVDHQLFDPSMLSSRRNLRSLGDLTEPDRIKLPTPFHGPNSRKSSQQTAPELSGPKPVENSQKVNKFKDF